MKLAFSSIGCPDWSLQYIAQNAQEMGYDGVELSTCNNSGHSFDLSLKQAAEIGRYFCDHGVPIFALQDYSNFARNNDQEIFENEERLRLLIAIAETIGAKYIRTFAGPAPQGMENEEVIDHIASSLKPLASNAADHGITIGLETHDELCSSDYALKIIHAVNRFEGLGLVYNIYDCFHKGLENLEDTYGKLKGHICYCHLKDGYTASDGRQRIVLLGAGDLPLQRLLSRFKNDKYDGFVSFEWPKQWQLDLEPQERAFPHFIYKVRSLLGEKLFLHSPARHVGWITTPAPATRSAPNRQRP